MDEMLEYLEPTVTRRRFWLFGWVVWPAVMLFALFYAVAMVYWTMHSLIRTEWRATAVYGFAYFGSCLVVAWAQSKVDLTLKRFARTVGLYLGMYDREHLEEMNRGDAR